VWFNAHTSNSNDILDTCNIQEHVDAHTILGPFKANCEHRSAIPSIAGLRGGGDFGFL